MGIASLHPSYEIYEIQDVGWVEALCADTHQSDLSFPEAIEVMHRAMTGADGEAVSNGLRDVALGMGHGAFQFLPFRQVRGNGR